MKIFFTMQQFATNGLGLRYIMIPVSLSGQANNENRKREGLGAHSSSRREKRYG